MDAVIGTGKISQRKYEIKVERNISVPMSDGVNMDVDIFRPADTKERFPALLAVSPYDKEAQSDRVWPVAIGTSFIRGQTNGNMEAGPSDFFVRRGYVHIKGSARGTGKSGGAYQWLSPREIRDIYDLCEWAAKQPWCNGNVGMIGISYFGWVQILAAAQQPPHLKCIFPFNAATDQYRTWYHGGIRWESFVAHLLNLRSLDIHTDASAMKEYLGEKAFGAALAKALEDEEICANPIFVDALKNPDKLSNSIKVDFLLNSTADSKYWKDRYTDFDAIKIPVYGGACWHKHSLHLPGAFELWANLKNVPKKMLIGPQYGPDRPLYQLAWEMLRWYDYWLKGIDTGIMDEPPIKLFIMGSNEWRFAEEWPLPETRWIPFFLHSNGMLCEMEPWPDAAPATFEDSPSNRGYLKYYSPRLVEDTEVCGPASLTLYASSRDTDIHFFISLWDADEEGKETLLTRGWLKGSHLTIDPKKSKQYKPYHPHANPEPLVPGRVYKFPIEIIPTANLFKFGHKIVLKISGADNEKNPNNPHEEILTGHSWRQTTNKITVLHDADHPSNLLLPITKGNIFGTYVSGGLLG